MKWWKEGCSCSPEVGWFIGMRGLQLGHEDPEDVEEEEYIASYAQEAREVSDPLNPNLRRKRWFEIIFGFYPG